MPETKLQNCLLDASPFPENYTQDIALVIYLSVMHRVRIE